MIGTRTPFRISFAGGGSDLREFYLKHPGCVLSTTINKYIFIFVHPFFDESIQVKYSRTELVNDINNIEHPIVREALKKFAIRGIDINSIADIPAGTGLGSSGSFTVGLLHALYAYCGQTIQKETLARDACIIEIDVLKEPIGKQDQYCAAYGGLNLITFYPDETVGVEPVIMTPEKYSELENNLLYFYIGGQRMAREVLADEKQNLISEEKIFSRIKRMADLAGIMSKSLSAGRMQDIGPMLDEGWNLKKGLSIKIADDKMNYYYELARKNGAAGGKLLGAGGGGFLMFYCEQAHQDKLRLSLKDLKEYRFKFDLWGTRIIYDSGHEENGNV